MKPIPTFSFLSLLFLAFSFRIYLKPSFSSAREVFDKTEASQGRLVWQKYNCQSCHQLYGLGGYLGPDLTNVYSSPGKGAPLLRAILKTGSSPMPAFDLSEQETDLLIEFLKSTDASGSANPLDFTILPDGMTRSNEQRK